MSNDLPAAAVEVLSKEPDSDVVEVEATAASLFRRAAEVLEGLMEDEDAGVRLKAAAKVVDLQISVYKGKKASKRPVLTVSDKLFDDGFTF